MTNALLAWLVNGVLIAAVATIAARLMPASAPSRRHAFWWLVLAAILAVPWIPAALDRSGVVTTGVTTSLTAPTGTALGTMSLLTIPAPPRGVLLAAAVLWAASVLLSFIALARSVFETRRLADTSRLLPLERARFRTFESVRCSSRAVRVCVSDDIRGACAVGYLRPRILISSALIASLDDTAVEAILLHEYAHLQRYDDWVGVLQRIVCAVVGLHPAVWWTSRHIDIEREAACDRRVVTLTGAPFVYARALTLAAEIVMRGGAFTPVAAPGASVSGAGFHARVVRVLNGQVASPRRARSAAGAGVVALALAVAASSRLPPIIVAASMQRPLAELAAVPLDPGVVLDLPAVARFVWAEQGRVAAAPRTARTRVAPVADSVPTEDVVPSPVAGEEPMPAVVATNLLGVVPLALQISMPNQAGVSVVSSLKSDAQDSEGIGARAARAGTATRDAYVRAGLSVGRLFWRRGRAVADRF